LYRRAVKGIKDNSLGAVATSSATDAWAVGNFIGDTPDATLSHAAHFGGTSWTSVPTPNVGPNFNTFFGVAASGGQAWAVGAHLDDQYRDRALIEHWDGSAWTVADSPQPGSGGDILFAASASSPNDVWAVGEKQGSDGVFTTLAEYWDGQTSSVTPTPNPGPSGSHLFGVVASAPEDVWAVGQQLNGEGRDQALIEHWDGTGWSVMSPPNLDVATSTLDSVTVGAGGVWAVGKTEDPVLRARPLVIHRPRAGTGRSSPRSRQAFGESVGVSSRRG
jgi:hypothetical protein